MRINIIFIVLFFFTIYSYSNRFIAFIENRGQIHTQYLTSNSTVRFMCEMPGLNIQLKENGFSYETYVQNKPNKFLTSASYYSFENSNALMERIDIEFIGANKRPEIIKELPMNVCLKYYVNRIGTIGEENTIAYSKIIYKNLYPNIDLEFVIEKNAFKYNFIVKKGGDFNVIKWKYSNNSKPVLNGKKLTINSKYACLFEEIPECYFESSNCTRKYIEINYKKFRNGVFGFQTNCKSQKHFGDVLIIDPILIIDWSTFIGGPQSDFISGSCIDKFGNTYYVGTTSSLSSIATTGAYQTAYGGGMFDVILFKFNPFGALLWCTYFGGNDYDSGISIAIDKSNDIYICGVTSSTNSIATIGSFQTSYGGGAYDGFHAKFDTNGNLLWSTYYGGSGDDQFNSCHNDTLGNLFLSGLTSSTVSITTLGTYQPNYGGGPCDAMLVKFTPGGSRIWATYYGGNNGEVFNSCKVDSVSNQIYLGGFTNSTISISTAGSHQVGFGGMNDAFLTKFTTGGSRLWATYYGGSGNDLIRYINCDTLGNIYVTGETISVDSVASIGSHQSTYGGAGIGNNGDAFLAKFDTSGTRKWGTYYGGSNDDSGLCIDISNSYVYLCGVTQSPNQISTPNTFQNNLTSSFADMFITKFDLNGNRVWATYLGGGGNDIASSMLHDGAGDIYVSGSSDGPFPISSGAYQPTSNGMFEGAVVKFKDSPLLIGTDNLKKQPSIKIVPNPVSHSLTISTKTTFEKETKIEIVNTLGQTVLKLNYSNEIDVSILEQGLYTLKIITPDKHRFHSKFLKE